jgi:hypothetical protein
LQSSGMGWLLSCSSLIQHPCLIEMITLAVMCYTPVLLVCSLTLLMESNSITSVLLAVVFGNELRRGCSSRLF